MLSRSCNTLTSMALRMAIMFFVAGLCVYFLLGLVLGLLAENLLRWANS